MFEATVRILVGRYVASRCWKKAGTIAALASASEVQSWSSRNNRNWRTALAQDCIVFALLFVAPSSSMKLSCRSSNSLDLGIGWRSNVYVVHLIAPLATYSCSINDARLRWARPAPADCSCLVLFLYVMQETSDQTVTEKFDVFVLLRTP